MVGNLYSEKKNENLFFFGLKKGRDILKIKKKQNISIYF